MVRISSKRIDMEGGRIDRPILKDYNETLVGGAGGTTVTSSCDLDLSQGNAFNIILGPPGHGTDPCVFTFSNPTASGTACSFVLYLQQDSTGSRTASWPSSVIWPSGIAPTLTTTARYMDILSFFTLNGGTTWFGFTSAQSLVVPQFWLPFGYFGGGGTPTGSIVDRIDYANDTATASVKGSLSLTRFRLGATGNASFGYFGGGTSTSNWSTVDRIDYSNDTPTAVGKGPLSLARSQIAATGNSAFGYFGGGYNPPTTFSTVDRIDYSSDTSTAVAKGPFSAVRRYRAATGTFAFGYFGAGIPNTAVVDRVDYSSDTSTSLTKGPLAAARYAPAATSNSSFGYFGGGASPLVTRVDRIDYSNDTATAAVKGPLSLARVYPAASGNSAFGYFGGGNTGGGGSVSTVDRVDYSNDTATAALKGPLSAARYQLAATNHAAM